MLNARKAHSKIMDDYAFEAKLYDKIWGRYDYDTDVKFLNRLFKKHRCRTIIDIGCGTGNHAERLASLGYDVTALVISPAMLKILKKKVKGNRIRVKQGDMKKLAGIH